MHPKALLDAATELVRLTLRFEYPADAVLSRFFRDHRKTLGLRDRGVLAAAISTVLRHKLRLEHLAAAGSGPRERRLAILAWLDSQAELATQQHPQDVASAQKASRAQRDFVFSALTEPEKRWIEACDRIDSEALLDRHRYSLPDWVVEALKTQCGADWRRAAEALNSPAGLDVRVNALKAKREAVQASLRGAGLVAVATPYSPWGLRLTGRPDISGLPAFVAGEIEVQDEGSQMLALLLEARRGEMVVDFCAGAGGKTLALGADMRNTGRLYAFDTSAHRLDALKPRLARSGLSNVFPAAIAHERDDRIKRLAGKVDRVLVDAPCSGLGTLRRNPDLKWRQSPKAVAELVGLQTRILESAARLLKPGGRLLYATCSLLPAENEGVAQAFAEAHASEFTPLAAAECLQALQVPDAAGLCGEDGQFLRLWPHRHGCDAFFAALWTRKA